MKDPITCPKCATSFLALQILPSKTELPGMPQPVAPKPRETEVNEEQDTGEVELISLEEAEAAEKGDDETAGIEDVDLGEDSTDANEDEDDTFLVEEEEDGNMSDLVEGGGKGEDEEH